MLNSSNANKIEKILKDLQEGKITGKKASKLIAGLYAKEIVSRNFIGASGGCGSNKKSGCGSSSSSGGCGSSSSC